MPKAEPKCEKCEDGPRAVGLSVSAQKAVWMCLPCFGANLKAVRAKAKARGGGNATEI